MKISALFNDNDIG